MKGLEEFGLGEVTKWNRIGSLEGENEKEAMGVVVALVRPRGGKTSLNGVVIVTLFFFFFFLSPH